MKVKQSFVINLDESTERLAAFRASFDPVWPWEHRPIRRHRGFRMDRIHVPGWFQLSAGACGCLAAHASLWDFAGYRKVEHMAVFEDDARAAPDFAERIMPFLDAVPDDWDIIYLGGKVSAPSKYKPQRVNNLVVRVPRVAGTWGYIVRRRFAEQRMADLTRFPLEHVDQRIIKLGGVYYAPRNEWLVHHAAGKSTITGEYLPNAICDDRGIKV